MTNDDPKISTKNMILRFQQKNKRQGKHLTTEIQIQTKTEKWSCVYEGKYFKKQNNKKKIQGWLRKLIPQGFFAKVVT